MRIGSTGLSAWLHFPENPRCGPRGTIAIRSVNAVLGDVPAISELATSLHFLVLSWSSLKKILILSL